MSIREKLLTQTTSPTNDPFWIDYKKAYEYSDYWETHTWGDRLITD
jgi:hypothetical protein